MIPPGEGRGFAGKHHFPWLGRRVDWSMVIIACADGREGLREVVLCRGWGWRLLVGLLRRISCLISRGYEDGFVFCCYVCLFLRTSHVVKVVSARCCLLSVAVRQMPR